MIFLFIFVAQKILLEGVGYFLSLPAFSQVANVSGVVWQKGHQKKLDDINFFTVVVSPISCSLNFIL